MESLFRAVVLASLAGCATVGDVQRGREVFVSRDQGHCVLCHTIAGTAAGNVGPSLANVGSRLTPREIRARIEDITRITPNAAMPTYHRTEGLTRVASQYAGKPVLSREQVEDVAAYLSTLK
jgi:sulfur-oxidizing protein SoxX